MQGVAGIHKDKKLPAFASKTFAAQFSAQRQPVQGEPNAKIAFFSTCYVNYNDPQLGLDTLEVMACNNVDVSFAYERCCMPLWHNGDMEGAIELARKNVANLLRFVNDGKTIVATNPTCSQRFASNIQDYLEQTPRKSPPRHRTRWSFLRAWQAREN
jgi:glycerol-3-phosphate dehydrogenase subunit C